MSVVTSTRSPAGGPLADLLEQVRHLRPRRRRLRSPGSSRPVGRITCSTTSPPVLLQFVRPGRGRDEDHLVDLAAPTPRTAAAGCPARWAAGSRARPASPCGCGRRRTSPRICGTVTCDSSTNSRKSSGKKSNSVSGGRPGGRPAQRPAVVLDARAVADLLQHLDVEPRPRVQPLGFEQLALLANRSSRSSSSCLISPTALLDPLLGQDEVLGRIDEQLRPARSITSPLVGLMSESCSTSSPQNSIRQANSS